MIVSKKLLKELISEEVRNSIGKSISENEKTPKFSAPLIPNNDMIESPSVTFKVTDKNVATYAMGTIGLGKNSIGIYFDPEQNTQADVKSTIESALVKAGSAWVDTFRRELKANGGTLMTLSDIRTSSSLKTGVSRFLSS